MQAAKLSSSPVVVTMCASVSWMDSDMGSRKEIHRHYPPINKQENPLNVTVHIGPVLVEEANGKGSD